MTSMARGLTSAGLQARLDTLEADITALVNDQHTSDVASFAPITEPVAVTVRGERISAVNQEVTDRNSALATEAGNRATSLSAVQVHAKNTRSVPGTALTVNSPAAWVDVDSVTDITLPAKIGDFVEVSISCNWGGEAVVGYFDVVSMNGSTPVNSWASDAPFNTNPQVTQGVQAWRGEAGSTTEGRGSIGRVLIASDIVGGNVKLRMKAATASATNKTLNRATNLPIHFMVVNYGNAVVPADPPPAPEITAVTWISGERAGPYDGTGNPPTRDADITTFQNWREHPVLIISDFQAGADNPWSAVEGVGPLDNMKNSIYHGSLHGANFEICNIMLPGDTNTTTLAAGAAGAYDAHWDTWGANIVAQDMYAAYLRWGHEMNGNWYRWSVNTNVLGGNPNGGTADFITYWRRIHARLRAAGWTGKSVWCVNGGISATTSQPELAYPGDDVVDVISVDAYDQSWVAGSYPYVAGETAAQRYARQLAAWNDIKGGPRGLDFWAGFASTHSKKLAVSEWGVFTRYSSPGVQESPQHGGMDNPNYIAWMFDWFHSLGSLLEFESMLNENASDGDHKLGTVTNFPLASSQYHQLWSR